MDLWGELRSVCNADDPELVDALEVMGLMSDEQYGQALEYVCGVFGVDEVEAHITIRAGFEDVAQALRGFARSVEQTASAIGRALAPAFQAITSQVNEAARVMREHDQLMQQLQGPTALAKED